LTTGPKRKEFLQVSYSPEVIILTDLQYSPIKPTGTRPAGAHVLGSLLNEQGIDTLVIDYFTHIQNLWEILSEIKTDRTKIVCISTTFLSAPKIQLGVDERKSGGTHNMTDYKKDAEKDEWQEIYDRSIYLWLENEEKASKFFADLKNAIPGVTIIGGGPRGFRLYQLLEQETFKNCAMTNFDYFVLGPGDDILPALCNQIISKKVNPFLNFENKSGVKFIKTVDSRKPIPQIKFMPSSFIRPEEWLPIEVSRGCGFNCSYCSFEKNTIHKKSKADIVEEMTRNYETWGTTGYQVSADCLNDNRKFVEEFCDAIASLSFKIEFASYARLDLFGKFPQHIDMLLDCGFKAGFVGVETLNHEAGKKARRGLTPEKQKYLLKLLKDKGEEREGFWLSIYTIYGLPFETESSLDETNLWMQKQNFIDEITPSVLEVYEFQEGIEEIANWADMAKNPQKFGFTKLLFSPKFYWEHETMNVITAIQKKNEFLDMMANHPYSRVGGSSLGEYSATRTIGFNHDQAVIILKNRMGKIGKNLLGDVTKERKKQLRQLVLNKNKEKIDSYAKNLATLKRPNNQLQSHLDCFS